MKKILSKCLTCGKEFLIRECIIKSGRGKYCSKKCYCVEHSKKMSGKNNPMFGVKRCGEKSPHFKGGLTETKCKKCGKSIFSKPSRILKHRGVFCSKLCHNNYMFKGGRRESWKRRYKKIKEDPQLRLRSRVSSLVVCRLKKRLISKKGKSTFSFLPYTIDDLKRHLEKQFEHWMNWKNWGVGVGCWSIDHIKPDSGFDYKSVEDKEFQKCWALKNLRPMDAIENIKKSAKIISY